MCGISGIVATPGSIDRGVIADMLKAQRHRGPDGEHHWKGCVGDREVVLVHHRLAIIDLTTAADQPMFSSDERYCLIYNGEIYNYLELRRELEAEGVQFQTRSDTEVLLRAIVHWEVEALNRFNGMWAFALLDRARGTLMLSRDRLGVKPLYVHEHDGALYFGSEIKAILAAARHRFRINSTVADRYLLQQQLDAQADTFFDGISALPAGSWLTVDLRGRSLDLSNVRRFWELPREDRFSGDHGSRIDAVRSVVHDSVRLRMRSDVPVGILLSGGLDSSAIAAAAKRALNGGGQLNVLSAVNEEPRYNEELFIDRMALHLGCAVHKVRLQADARTLFANVDRAVFHNDEPIGGLASVAHMQLMEVAREQGITVLLTGQGADELTCGYLKYLAFHVQELLRSGRMVAAGRVLAQFARNRTVLGQFSFGDARRYLPSFLRPPIPDVRGPAAIASSDPLPIGLDARLVDRQAADLTRFSVPALVHYEDRMSMSQGREVRTPFLDYRLVELMQPMDASWKLRDGWTKWILRAAMDADLPPEICWRRDKQGFVTPENLWVARELRADVEEMIDAPMLTHDWGLVDQRMLKRRFQQYIRRWGGPFAMRAQDILAPLLMERWARVFESSLSGAA
jgi:asparagine synthase (glutamine-hydrolysing)